MIFSSHFMDEKQGAAPTVLNREPCVIEQNK